jgi:hypothetical protein
MDVKISLERKETKGLIEEQQGSSRLQYMNEKFKPFIIQC